MTTRNSCSASFCSSAVCLFRLSTISNKQQAMMMRIHEYTLLFLATSLCTQVTAFRLSGLGQPLGFQRHQALIRLNKFGTPKRAFSNDPVSLIDRPSSSCSHRRLSGALAKRPLDDSSGQGMIETSATTSSVITITWKESLMRFSNVASLLCVVDCTVLPIVTLALPLFGIIAATPSQIEWIHNAGHFVALGFVVPVGLLATCSNYLFSHRKLRIAMTGWLGILSIILANMPCAWIPPGGGTLGYAIPVVLHQMHHGWAHRLVNIFGCALLLGSNYLSRRMVHTTGSSCSNDCSHDHDYHH